MSTPRRPSNDRTTSAVVVTLIVPFGVAAAILALFLTGTSLNIYSQIGLVLLIGLMAKNSVLVVEFADGFLAELDKFSGMIWPFDVESCLIEHDAVMESAVVGKPDAERGHIVKAFVVLSDGFDPSDALSEELRQHVRARLGAHAYPREIAFMEQHGIQSLFYLDNSFPARLLTVLDGPCDS